MRAAMTTRGSLAVAGVASAACGRVGFEALSVDGSLPDAFDAAAIVDGGPRVENPALYISFDTEGLVDGSGRGHTITCKGSCPTTTAGHVGAAGSFDGNSCLGVGDRADLRPASFTFAAWVAVVDNRLQTAFSRPYMGTTTNANSYEIYANTGQWILTVGNNSRLATTTSTSWIHLAGVLEAPDSFTMYVDGVSLGTSTAPTQFADGDDIFVGCERDVDAIVNRFAGAIDEVLFYDRALTASDIAVLAGL